MTDNIFCENNYKDVIDFLFQNEQYQRTNRKSEMYINALESIKQSQFIKVSSFFIDEIELDDIVHSLLTSFQLEKYQIGSNLLQQSNYIQFRQTNHIINLKWLYFTDLLIYKNESIYSDKFVLVLKGQIEFRCSDISQLLESSDQQSTLQNENKINLKFKKRSSLQDENSQEIIKIKCGEAITPENYKYYQNIQEVLAENNDELGRKKEIYQEDFIYLATLNHQNYMEILYNLEEQKINKIKNQLQNSDNFNGLNEDKLNLMVSLFKMNQYKINEVIYDQNIHTCLNVFLVFYGEFFMTQTDNMKGGNNEQSIKKQIITQQRIQQSISNSGLDMPQRLNVKQILKNQIFGEDEEINYGQNRNNKVICKSQNGIILIINKNCYQNIIQNRRDKSHSHDYNNISQESPTLVSGNNDFFVRQNFTQASQLNHEFNSQINSNIQNSDYQGNNTPNVMSKLSSINQNRQFTKLQISQMQNNCAPITRFSKTNKQLQDILNSKLQVNKNVNSSQPQSGTNSNKEIEDPDLGSNRNSNNSNRNNNSNNNKHNINLFTFKSTSISQGFQSNSSSKCQSPIISQNDMPDLSPTKIKSSQFRVRKYQSERQIDVNNDTNDNLDNDHINNENHNIINKNNENTNTNKNKNKISFTRNNNSSIFSNKNISQFDEYEQTLIDKNIEQQNQSDQKNQNNFSGQTINPAGFHIKMKFNMGITQKGDNNGIFSQSGIQNKRNLSEMISQPSEIFNSPSQRGGFQSPQKASFSPAAGIPLRRTLLMDQSPSSTFKKRTFYGKQFGSVSSLNTFGSGRNSKSRMGSLLNQNGIDYPISDVIESDSQKNAGQQPIQSFTAQIQQQKSEQQIKTSSSFQLLQSQSQPSSSAFVSLPQKINGVIESSPKLNTQDILGRSKITFQYRRKPSSNVVGSCNDFQSLKNIDADEQSKLIQSNIYSQLSLKNCPKNSSAIFFSSNTDKSPFSSQQNIIMSGKQTSGQTKAQLLLNSKTSPKKNFIVMKKQDVNTQESNNLIPSIHNMAISHNEIYPSVPQLQANMNSNSSFFAESDESFMMYDDYANNIINSAQEKPNTITSQPNISQEPINHAILSQRDKPSKLKPAIPLLDLKNIGNENSKINNFFGGEQQNNQNNGNTINVSKSQQNLQNGKIENKQNNQSDISKQQQQQRQQPLSIRPSTPSIKKLDLTNLNEQIKKSTPANIQKEEGYNEITQSRLILPSFSLQSPQIPQQNNEQTPQNKFEFFSPHKALQDRKSIDLNIFSTLPQSQNNNQYPLSLNQNKTKQSIQNYNSLYQGLLSSSSYKKKSFGNNQRKSEIQNE